MKTNLKSLPLYLYQAFNVIVSLLLFVVVYLISHGKSLGFFSQRWWSDSQCGFLKRLTVFFDGISPLWSYIVYLLIVVLLTWVVIRLFPKLDDDELQNGESIKTVEEASYMFYPNYLAYFFVALSAQDKYAVLIVFFIMFIISYKSATMLYNPLFVLFNYRYYMVVSQNNKKFLVITKKVLNPGTTEPVSFTHLKRMNDNTFIDYN